MFTWLRAAALSCLLLATGTAGGFADDRATQPGPTAPTPAPAADTVNTGQLMIPGPLEEKTLGDPQAPVTVVEYVSMTCPHCARFATDTFPAFKAKYIDTGKAFYILREFPLDQLALVAIAGARCAPGDKFFEIVERLFREQQDWAFVNQPAPALISRLADEGLTKEQFTTCLNDSTLIQNIMNVEDRASKAFGVEGTPTFFFNGQRHVGELTMAQADALMEPLLKP